MTGRGFASSRAARLPSPWRDGSGHDVRGGGEAGYSLVFLVIIFTVLSILVAAALPLWSHAIQRDKEEELISRGLQYAEAIRVFQLRNGRPPVKLDELLEAKPRCIRRLWKDPMTEDGKWGLVFVNQNPTLQVQPGAPNDPKEEIVDPNFPDRKGGGRAAPPSNPGGDDSSEEPSNENNPHAPPKKGDTVAVGPIMGVHSKSHKKSILIFNGRERYDEWMFTTDLINQTRVETQGAAVPLGPVSADPGSVSIRSLRWIGRPFPPFLDPMKNGGLPNGQAPTNPNANPNPRSGGFKPAPPNPRKPFG